jgi:regulatory protein
VASGDPTPFRDAEAWLAERGIEREPIRVGPAPDPGGTADPDLAADPAAVGRADDARGTTDPGVPPVTARDAQRLAQQAAADAAVRAGERTAAPDPTRRHLEDDVAAAVAFVRRSTAVAPQSEGRLRAKLADRGVAASVIDRALDQARTQRLVDDAAMAAAFVDERRRRGHAAARIRTDLRERGFDEPTIAAALAAADHEDPEAAAFAVARDRAAGLTGVPAEVAFRRVVGHLTRRGYPDGLARKAARQAVFASRDDERAAGR